jgi:DNA-binding response OmpR family regulator
VPIIVLTAADPALAERQALELGATAFFQKPADHHDLLASIELLLGEAERRELLAAS